MSEFCQNTLDCFMNVNADKFPIHSFELEQYCCRSPSKDPGLWSVLHNKIEILAFGLLGVEQTSSSPQKVRKVIYSRITDLEYSQGVPHTWVGLPQKGLVCQRSPLADVALQCQPKASLYQVPQNRACHVSEKRSFQRGHLCGSVG